ncbi:MAG: tyrosine-type recombinase/integrase, partial [Desulfobacterales bacterium]
SILAQCPVCNRKQSIKNKKCKCGNDMDKSKRTQKVKFWINFRLPDKTQRREPVGYSIEEAKDADGKRRVQKRENRIFDMLPESNMSFKELSDWYLGLKSVKKLASYQRITIALNNFNSVFENKVTGTILPVDLENYQEKRLEDGLAPGTLDVELAIVKGMITKAFDNDMLDGRVLKAFRKVKNKLKRGANARKRTIAIDEYHKLLDKAPKHLKPMLIMDMNTGMRPGELKDLRWPYVDRKAGFIILPAEITKEGKEKKIPINHNVETVLDSLIRHIDHDYVFTFGGKPITSAGGVKNALRGTCKRANVPYGRETPNGIIMHDFRRTVKTNMLSAGIRKTYRDMILGHSLQGMDVHYIAPTDEDLKQAMAQYTQWLDDQIASVDHFVDQTAIGEV